MIVDGVLMHFTHFLDLADSCLKQPLEDAGFLRVAAGTWNFRKEDDLNILWLQKHSSESLFCVNLGIHYAFLPKAGTEAPLIDSFLEQPDCEIKLRLTDGAEIKDQWWPVAPDAIDAVANLVSHRGLAIFDSYRLAGSISSMEGKDVEAGNLGLLSSLTKVRACLLLARMHERLGNRTKCIEAANIGIKLAGMAVGPKKALKEILKRTDN